MTDTTQAAAGDAANGTDGHPSGIVFVPHTHWDREWYEPFQVFRFRLVEALDQVLETAERDPQFRFTLDGQTAAVEDYLEIRPENTERIKAIVRSGQLALGPWLILLDEFLCTGETIIRNLQLGWSGAERLGGAMPVGYLPDMFGHVAQMPQILNRAGITTSAFWRGVPGTVDGHQFRWVAPDGSSVRSEFLFDGYDNALDFLLVPDEIPRALRDYHRLTKERWGDEPILGMVGTDHMAPNPELMNWVRRFDEAAFPIAVETLTEYFERYADDAEGAAKLVDVIGELRSHQRGNILPGVISIRLGLKESMAVAERVLDEAERVAARWSDEDFEPFFDIASRGIIESTAHDSVVGSGTDETVEQVAARLAESAQAARSVRDGVLRELAKPVSSDAYVVVNTLPRDRTIFVDVEVASPDEELPLVAKLADGTVLHVQEIGRTKTVLGDERMDASQVDRVIRRIHRRELFGQDIDTCTIEPNRLTFRVAEIPKTPVFDLLATRDALTEAAAAYPGEWHVLTLAEPRRRVLVAVPVPASGSTSFTIAQGESEANVSPITASGDAAGATIGNGLVSATINADGTATITGADGTVLEGVGRLVDEGDRGDSYNFGPISSGEVIDAPTNVVIETVEVGDVRAVVRALRTYALPVSLSEDVDVRSTQTVDTTIETRYEVRAGEGFVRVSVEYVNQIADHRLRLHVPLPEAVTGSASEGQFSVTERGLTSEGGWGEFPIPTFPATSFVNAGPATVLLKHATEYEVVGDGTELAITLVRAVGSISVNVHPLRDEPAGSEIPIPGGQELGTTVLAEFGVVPVRGGWQPAGAVALAEEFRADGLVVRGTQRSGGTVPAPEAGLRVDGADVQVTTIRRVGDATEVRLVALSASPVTATVSGAFASVDTVDLLGRQLSSEDAAGSVEVALGPWEIRTLHLR
ncbi:hypothetical protein ACL9RL_10430 [Plantibacter sp. Mn2098]|uniref:glycoside hydrolase family 38 N-terminal domain-containing protein n=1 Tax=Plantibacter sp. Mn2098 TaxID=3395266 RepID=UPI003BC75E76